MCGSWGGYRVCGVLVAGCSGFGADMREKSFRVQDYVDVAERIRLFYERFPEGSIQTELVRLEEGMVVFRASVYRDREDPHPTTGWAYEREGVGLVNKTSFIENCETSAVGRALSNLNFPRSREAQERSRGGEPASRSQLEELRVLAESESIDAGIRARVLGRLEEGLNARQAREALAYLRRLQRRGQGEAEAEAGAAAA